MIDLFEFYKIKDWVKVLGLVLIGYLASGATSTTTLLINLLVASLALSFARSINDYFDARIHREKNYILNLHKKIGTGKSIFLCYLPLILLTFVSAIFYLTEITSLAFLIFFVVLSYSYSSPPLRFRNRTFVELPINILMGVSVFAFVFLYNAIPSLIFYFFMFSVGWYFFVSESIHQVAHFNKDKIDGKVTTAIKLGKQKFLKILRCSFIIAFVISFVFAYLFRHGNLLILPGIFILANFMRLARLLKTDSKFETIRTKMYGMEEGALYIMSLFLLFYL